MDKTSVFFRVWRDDLIALFPLHWDNHEELNMVWSYMRTGQHGVANLRQVLADSAPAAPERYKSLQAELGNIGYDLKVISPEGHFSSSQTAMFVFWARLRADREWEMFATFGEDGLAERLRLSHHLRTACPGALQSAKQRQLIAWHEVATACLEG